MLFSWPTTIKKKKTVYRTPSREQRLSQSTRVGNELEKVNNAVTSSIRHLEDSAEALAKKNEAKLRKDVWHAAAELEYALFLLSLMNGEESRHRWKVNPGSKQTEIESLLESTRKLLETAKEDIAAKNPPDAHKKIWIARGYLLKIHDAYEKKRKEGK